MTSWALARARRLICPSLDRPYPLVIRRAQGSVVEDLDGNRYLDFTAGVTAGPVGHGPARVGRVIQPPTGDIAVAPGRQLDDDPILTLAKKLTHITPGETEKRVLFTNSLSESVEAAIRLACDHTGRNRVIAFDRTSHHQTAGWLTGHGARAAHGWRGRRSACTVDFLRYGDTPRLKQHIRNRRHSADEVAAILVEPMLVEAGCISPPEAFLPELRSLCDEHGILLIVDETQTGLGRTGKMFCCEHQAVAPDILLTAYGVASGRPVCAVVAPEAVMSIDWVWPGPAFSENPAHCRAALAAIELLERGLIANAAKLFSVARGKLERIAQRHGCIGSPRGLGLLLALDVARLRRWKQSVTELRDRIITEAFQRGLLLAPCGERTIRITPPLCVNRVQLEIGLDVFEEAVATASACSPR